MSSKQPGSSGVQPTSVAVSAIVLVDRVTDGETVCAPAVSAPSTSSASSGAADASAGMIITRDSNVPASAGAAATLVAAATSAGTQRRGFNSASPGVRGS